MDLPKTWGSPNCDIDRPLLDVWKQLNPPTDAEDKRMTLLKTNTYNQIVRFMSTKQRAVQIPLGLYGSIESAREVAHWLINKHQLSAFIDYIDNGDDEEDFKGGKLVISW